MSKMYKDHKSYRKNIYLPKDNITWEYKLCILPELLIPSYTWQKYIYKSCLECFNRGQLSCYMGTEYYYDKIRIFGFCFHCLDQRDIHDKFDYVYHYPRGLIEILKKPIRFRKDLTQVVKKKYYQRIQTYLVKLNIIDVILPYIIKYLLFI
jgi:hypothetical protein